MPNDVLLKWNWTGPPASFSIQVATDEGFENLIVDLINYGSTEYFLWGLDSNTKYYWKLRSSNESSISKWSDVWWFKTHSGSSVHSVNLVDIHIFPNPVGDVLNITGDDVDRISRISVVSILGEILILEPRATRTIHTAGLTPGVYILKMEIDKGVVIKQFIKQ